MKDKNISKLLFTLAAFFLAVSAAAGQSTIMDYQESIIQIEAASFGCLKVFEKTGETTEVNTTKLKKPNIMQNFSVNTTEAKNGTYNATTSIDINGTELQKHQCRRAKLRANNSLKNIHNPLFSSLFLILGLVTQLGGIFYWFEVEENESKPNRKLPRAK